MSEPGFPDDLAPPRLNIFPRVGLSALNLFKNRLQDIPNGYRLAAHLKNLTYLHRQYNISIIFPAFDHRRFFGINKTKMNIFLFNIFKHID